MYTAQPKRSLHFPQKFSKKFLFRETHQNNQKLQTLLPISLFLCKIQEQWNQLLNLLHNLPTTILHHFLSPLQKCIHHPHTKTNIPFTGFTVFHIKPVRKPRFRSRGREGNPVQESRNTQNDGIWGSCLQHMWWTSGVWCQWGGFCGLSSVPFSHLQGLSQLRTQGGT